jgi:predicted acyl esterase
MEEPPIHVFVTDTGEWKSTTEWPLPETRWTPFNKPTVPTKFGQKVLRAFNFSKQIKVGKFSVTIIVFI